MTNQQLSIYRQNASNTFVPAQPISAYELGRRDAMDNLQRLAVAYYHYNDAKRIRQYNEGYNSVSETYMLDDLAKAFQAFIGTPELDMLDAEAAEDRIAEANWQRHQEIDEAQSEYTDWRI